MPTKVKLRFARFSSKAGLTSISWMELESELDFLVNICLLLHVDSLKNTFRAPMIYAAMGNHTETWMLFLESGAHIDTATPYQE